MDLIDILDAMTSDELKVLMDFIIRAPKAVAEAIADRIYDLDFFEDEQADAFDHLADDDAIEEQFRMWEHEQAVQAGLGWEF